jgi:hypothetical protein
MPLLELLVPPLPAIPELELLLEPSGKGLAPSGGENGFTWHPSSMIPKPRTAIVVKRMVCFMMLPR